MYRPLPYHYPPPRKISWWEQHPALTTITVVFGLGVVATLWKALLVIAVLAGFGYGLYRLTLAFDRNHLQQVQARKAVEARAEYEHWRLMSGDVRTGVFGQFPPAV
jgi:hypothetical protein